MCVKPLRGGSYNITLKLVKKIFSTMMPLLNRPDGSEEKSPGRVEYYGVADGRKVQPLHALLGAFVLRIGPGAEQPTGDRRAAPIFKHFG